MNEHSNVTTFIRALVMTWIVIQITLPNMEYKDKNLTSTEKILPNEVYVHVTNTLAQVVFQSTSKY